MGEINNHEKTKLPYYRLYALLLEDARYSSMCLESVVLYSMLLSRLGLSEKNGWRDEKNNIFVNCTVPCFFRKLLSLTPKLISRYTGNVLDTLCCMVLGITVWRTVAKLLCLLGLLLCTDISIFHSASYICRSVQRSNVLHCNSGFYLFQKSTS